jgi:hypothetical protein
VTAGPAQAGRARFDIGDIVRGYRAQLETEHPLTPEQRRVLTDIAQCRTAALGGHVEQCPSCGYEHYAYHSCRNRHCPKCQALAQEHWIEQRKERLLDVGHFHVVFTLPADLRPLARCAPDVVFNAIFHAAAETLLELGDRRLRARLGATIVLHTWARDLRFHPHVHAIVTAGGLSLDGRCFRHLRGDFLFPVKVMGQLFRGKVLHILSEAYAAGLFAHVQLLHDPAAFGRLVARVSKLSWNVYAKEPFKKSRHVVDYLGRYTHRVGIASSRLVDVTAEHVVFRTRGSGTETLSPVQFLERLVQHVLPESFHKIRHIGLYASPSKLAAARALLRMPAPSPRRRRPSYEQKILELTGRDVRLCPHCLTPLVRLPLPSAARAPPITAAA